MYLLSSLGPMMDEGRAITSYIFVFHFLFHLKKLYAYVDARTDKDLFVLTWNMHSKSKLLRNNYSSFDL